MKFAHIRVSEYFTFAEQIFHSEAISLTRRANFVEKNTAFAVLFSWLPLLGSNQARGYGRKLPPPRILLRKSSHLFLPSVGAAYSYASTPSEKKTKQHTPIGMCCFVVFIV
jgi:hypothetical protein